MLPRGCHFTIALAVEDELRTRFNNAGYETQEYANDIVITIRGNDDQTTSYLLQSVLNTTQNWCAGVYLSINPSKMVILQFSPFIKWRKLNVVPPYLGEKTLELSSTNC